MPIIPTSDLGGGISLRSKPKLPPGTKLKHGESSQASRALALGSFFLSGAMAINASQFFGAPLYLINKDWYNAWIAFTKQSFGIMTMTMTQWWAPTVVQISGDKSMRGQLMKTKDGDLRCDFPERLVLIANHQIYTDWLYLWWIAYTNGMHGRLYIVLKESLKRIPILGWGMQLSQFIFMKRNWEKDKPNMQKHLSKLNQSTEPMWLVLFPEGTNLAPDTREKSRAWARKTGIKDMQHQLLPRSTGLHFCLQELQKTVGYLYDCTIAYDGVPRGQYAQDIYTLKASYLEGRPPKAVHIYWRRFTISSIPLNSPAVFEKWLRARWREKDYLLEMWHRTGQFPADSGAEKLQNGRIRQGCGYLETPVRPSQWYEFLQIFAPMGVLALVLSVFYGALPKSWMKSINNQAILAQEADLPDLQANGTRPQFSWGSLFTAPGQREILQDVASTLRALGGPGEQKALLAKPDASDGQISSKGFLKVMEDEERRCKKTKNAERPLKVPQKNFWQDLKKEEAKRNGSVVALTQSNLSSISRNTGTFWNDLKAEEVKRNGSLSTRTPSVSVSSNLSSVRRPTPSRALSTSTIVTNQMPAAQNYVKATKVAPRPSLALVRANSVPETNSAEKKTRISHPGAKSVSKSKISVLKATSENRVSAAKPNTTALKPVVTSQPPKDQQSKARLQSLAPKISAKSSQTIQVQPKQSRSAPGQTLQPAAKQKIVPEL